MRTRTKTEKRFIVGDGWMRMGWKEVTKRRGRRAWPPSALPTHPSSHRRRRTQDRWPGERAADLRRNVPFLIPQIDLQDFKRHVGFQFNKSRVDWHALPTPLDRLTRIRPYLRRNGAGSLRAYTYKQKYTIIVTQSLCVSFMFFFFFFVVVCIAFYYL